MTNKNNTTLYVGSTTNLIKRVYQHKNKTYKGFSARYNCNKLVYFEEYNHIDEAAIRERQNKAGSRKKKIDLINSINPGWKDLSEGWLFYLIFRVNRETDCRASLFALAKCSARNDVLKKSLYSTVIAREVLP